MSGGEADSGTIRIVRAQDGLRLAVRVFASADSQRMPLLCLPGLSRNSRDFLALARSESRHPDGGRAVYALDSRGRGLSDADPDWRNYTPLVEAQDVLAVAEACGITRAIIVGTSRGGILAMLLGALRPTLLGGVVLNDIGPVIEAAGLVRIKATLSRRRSFASWDAAAAGLREVAGAQFPRLSHDDWVATARAICAESDEPGLDPSAPAGGKSADTGSPAAITGTVITPQFDATLLHTLGDIDPSAALPTLWPQFESLAAVPLMAIRGENSDILSAATLAEMQVRHPGLETLTVPDEGHAPLLRDPPTLARLHAFFGRCDGGAAEQG